MRLTKVKQALFGTAAFLAAAAGFLAPSFPAVAAENDMKAMFNLHYNGQGWSDFGKDNTYVQAAAGTYVTGLKATLEGQPSGMSGTIAYQVNLSGSGWLGWEENYAQTGTTTTAMPLEAVKFKLTGQLGENYDIYYSVLQSGTWTDLVMNGQTAGIEDHGLRVDGLRLAVTKKGAGAPEDPPMPAVRTVDPTKPMVALTFDDGPSASTARIINSLEANGGRATFFMVGNRIEKYPSAVKRMVETGSEPASHTWAHTTLTKMSYGDMSASLDQVDNAVMSIAGVKTKLVRPPGGTLNDGAKANLAKKGVPSILWSIDTLDWKTKNPQSTIDAVLNNVKDGDIILMHDLYSQTADAAEVIIPELTKRGYQLVTVSELASYRGGMQAGQSYSNFRP